MSTCMEGDSTTFRYARKLPVGKEINVRCPSCHRSLKGTVTKSNGTVVTTTLPKHERMEPWHKRGLF